MTGLVPLAWPELDECEALRFRDTAWAQSPLIPRWVEMDAVGLDLIFTGRAAARRCYEDMQRRMAADNAALGDYWWVEPGAGDGAFYDLLPSGRRIGLDVQPRRSGVERAEFLTWQPPAGRRYAVVGNPPFGVRAWLALAFLNKAASFADYVGMILPMSFESDGKGSPKHRVVGLRLIHSELLDTDIFVHADGRQAKINTLWQVWERGVNNSAPAPACDQWVELFTVDTHSYRRCGTERLDEADWFLQRTFYKDTPVLVSDFSEVRYQIGYGIIAKQDKGIVQQALDSADWTNYSSLTTHNCRHISMHHIRRALTDAGLVDSPNAA